MQSIIVPTITESPSEVRVQDPAACQVLQTHPSWEHVILRGIFRRCQRRQFTAARSW